jgi:fused signal recognition particle receptor
MAEKKEGFFKKLFRFGKKSSPETQSEPAPDNAALQREEEARLKLSDEKVAAEQTQETERQIQAELAAREEQRAAEATKAAAEAEETARNEEQARLEVQQKAALEQEQVEQNARQMAEEKKREELLAQKQARKAVQDKEDADAKALAATAQQKQAELAAQEEQRAAEAEAEEAARIEEQARLEAQQKVATEQEAEEEAQHAAEAAKAEAEESTRIEEQARREAQQKATLEQEQAERDTRQMAEEKKREEQQALDLVRQAAQDKETADAKAQEAVREKQAELEAEEPASTAPESPVAEPGALPPTASLKKSWFSRLKDGLTRSSNQLTENITAVFTKRKLDEDTLQELEDILIQADLGVETAINITDALASQRMGKDITDEEVREFMAGEIEKVLDPVAAELELDLGHTPHVILVVGVNGSGKTTTIGKLSQKLFDGGFSTLLVAGDTFLAAAIEQLNIWGERTKSPVVSRPLGADAAGLAFDAYAQATEQGHDVMLMDTAGRLQNKTELMDELEKIIRVLKKQDPTAPHTVLLTLDATTGQNALNQVEIFRDVAGVNGLVMTKLDGTARGGIMVAIASKFKLPVFFIGVGEQVDDLEPFEAREFARSIAGLDL